MPQRECIFVFALTTLSLTEEESLVQQNKKARHLCLSEHLINLLRILFLIGCCQLLLSRFLHKLIAAQFVFRFGMVSSMEEL